MQRLLSKQHTPRHKKPGGRPTTPSAILRTIFPSEDKKNKWLVIGTPEFLARLGASCERAVRDVPRQDATMQRRLYVSRRAAGENSSSSVQDVTSAMI